MFAIIAVALPLGLLYENACHTSLEATLGQPQIVQKVTITAYVAVSDVNTEYKFDRPVSFAKICL